MKQTIYLSDGAIFETGDVVPPPNNTPLPVVPPFGFLVDVDLGLLFAVMQMDEFFEERLGLPQTNMVRPNRPVSTGLIGFIKSLFGLQVSPNGKHIVDIGGTTWWTWILEHLGWRNAEQFATPGDGNMDTNDPDVNIYSPDAELKLLSSVYGGALVHIIGEIFQNGSWFDIIETLDFNYPPVRGEDGVWRYKGEAITRATHPHLFVTRILRVETSIITWLTRNGINGATDGGIKGGKGDEDWPLISKVPVAQPRRLLRRYPTDKPMLLKLYKESLIVDGQLVDRPEGITILADKYIFYGSNTYVRDRNTQNWYRADELLVRANVDLRAPGNGFDYRCYVAFPESPKEPWMGFRGFRAPRCGWMRKNMDF